MAMLGCRLWKIFTVQYLAKWPSKNCAEEQGQPFQCVSPHPVSYLLGWPSFLQTFWGYQMNCTNEANPLEEDNQATSVYLVQLKPVFNDTVKNLSLQEAPPADTVCQIPPPRGRHSPPLSHFFLYSPVFFIQFSSFQPSLHSFQGMGFTKMYCTMDTDTHSPPPPPHLQLKCGKTLHRQHFGRIIWMNQFSSEPTLRFWFLVKTLAPYSNSSIYKSWGKDLQKHHLLRHSRLGGSNIYAQCGN